jgi:hypothetical protein
VPWHGRIQAGHVGVMRKKSFIVGKGKEITCSTGRMVLHACGKRKKNNNKRAIFYFGLFLYYLKFVR